MDSGPPPPPCPPPPPSAPLNITTAPTFEPSSLGLGIAAKIAGICARECTVLDLSNCEINSIPMAIFLLTKSFSGKIKEINLSSNQLKKLNLQTFFEKYRVVFLKCHILGVNQSFEAIFGSKKVISSRFGSTHVILGHFWLKQVDFGHFQPFSAIFSHFRTFSWHFHKTTLYPNLKIIDLTNNPLSKRQIKTIESHNVGVDAVASVVYEEGNGNGSDIAENNACLCKIKYKLMWMNRNEKE